MPKGLQMIGSKLVTATDHVAFAAVCVGPQGGCCEWSLLGCWRPPGGGGATLGGDASSFLVKLSPAADGLPPSGPSARQCPFT
jgi:hypothetical protein